MYIYIYTYTPYTYNNWITIPYMDIFIIILYTWIIIHNICIGIICSFSDELDSHHLRCLRQPVGSLPEIHPELVYIFRVFPITFH